MLSLFQAICLSLCKYSKYSRVSVALSDSSSGMNFVGDHSWIVDDQLLLCENNKMEQSYQVGPSSFAAAAKESAQNQ